MAGFARRAITPKAPTYLAGYETPRLSEGVRDELYVRAMVLGDGKATIAIVSIDLIWVSRSVVDAIRFRCSQELSLRPETILIATTHTHSGPETRENSFYSAGIDFDVRARLIGACCEALRDAAANLAPARLSVATGSYMGGINRRRRVVDVDGLRNGRLRRVTRNRPNPSGPRDTTVPVLWIENESGGRWAVVVYGCHPTFLRQGQISADYPGALAAELETSSGTRDVLFLQGCSANVVPAFVASAPIWTGSPRSFVEHLVDGRRFAKPRSDAEGERRMLSFARELADAVSSAPRRPISDVTLAAREEDVALDFDHAPAPARDARRGALPPFESAYEQWVAAFSAGGQAPPTLRVQRLSFSPHHHIVAIEGEVFAEYAMWLRARLGGGDTWLATVSCANGMLGYVPTAAALREGGYETDRSIMMSGLPSRLGGDTEERVQQSILRLLDAASRTA